MASEFKFSVIKLTGDNFPDWSFSLKMVASAYGIWDQFCLQAPVADSLSFSSSSSSGTIAKKAEKAETESAPSSSSALQQAVRVETAKAWALLMQSIDIKFHVHVRGCATPAEAYNFLQEQHSATSTMNINNILSDFFELTLDDAKDLEDLIRKLSSLREQHDSLVSTGERLQDRIYINQLLRAVSCDGRFSATVAAIKSRDTNLSLSALHARLLSAEADFKRTDKPKVAAMTASNTQTRQCVGCGKIGHFFADCRFNPSARKKSNSDGTATATSGGNANQHKGDRKQKKNKGKQQQSEKKEPEGNTSNAGKKSTVLGLPIVGSLPSDPSTKLRACLDSGSSIHALNNPSLLSDAHSADFNGLTIDGSTLSMPTKGTLSVTTPLDPSNVIHITDVHGNDQMLFSALSVGRLTSAGCVCVFKGDYGEVFREDQLLLQARKRDFTYWVDLNPIDGSDLDSESKLGALPASTVVDPPPCVVSSAIPAEQPSALPAAQPSAIPAEQPSAIPAAQPFAQQLDISPSVDTHIRPATQPVLAISNDSGPVSMDIWHQRFSHASAERLTRALKAAGIAIAPGDALHQCEACTATKVVRAPHPPADPATSISVDGPLHTVDIDIVGPFTPPTPEGFTFAMPIKDRSTNFRWTFLLKRKSQAPDLIRKWAMKATKQLRERSRTPRFILSTALSDVGRIRLDMSGEQSSATFTEWAAQEGIDLSYTLPSSPEQDGHAENNNKVVLAAARASRIQASLPRRYWGSAVLFNMLPLNCIPNRDGVTPYQRWYGLVPPVTNLRPFGSICYVREALVGRKADPQSVKARLIGYCQRGLAYIVETIQSDGAPGRVRRTKDVAFVGNTAVSVGGERVEVPPETAIALSPPPSPAQPVPSAIPAAPVAPPAIPDAQLAPASPVAPVIPPEPPSPASSRSSSPPMCPPRHSTRQRRAPLKLQDYIAALPTVPANAQAALQNDAWRKSMMSELDGLLKNGTFKPLSSLPAGKTAIDCVWSYKIKKQPDGSLKLKSRLCARGFKQKPFQDYDPDSISSPVMRPSTARLIFADSMQTDAELGHVDVVSAFTQATLGNYIIVKRPIGMPDDIFPGIEWFVLVMSLYGLKQASFEFYTLLSATLLKLHFRATKHDPCLYVRFYDDGRRALIGTHVDDLLCSFPKGQLQPFISALSEHLEIVSHGKPTRYLSNTVSYNSDGSITLSQPDTVDSILEDAGMSTCSPAPTPMGTTIPKPRQQGEPASKMPYRALVGSLNYLATSVRPDIAFAVSVLARFVNDPSVSHDKALKRLLRYLQGTRDVGITFRKHPEPYVLFTAYSDSDYANAADAKSVTGHAVYCRGNLIHWRSTKQRRVSHSVCEAELLALAHLVKEAIYYRELAAELKLPDRLCPVAVNADNESTILIARTGAVSDNLKHIAAPILAIKEAIDEKVLSLSHVASAENVADIFTKPLAQQPFVFLRDALGMSHPRTNG